MHLAVHILLFMLVPHSTNSGSTRSILVVHLSIPTPWLCAGLKNGHHIGPCTTHSYTSGTSYYTQLVCRTGGQEGSANPHTYDQSKDIRKSLNALPNAIQTIL